MSYIDCHRHEHCGTLVGIPLYHPLEEYTDPLDFVATAENLVLGGGGGEHNAAVFNLPLCALWVVQDVVLDLLEEEEQLQANPAASEWFMPLLDYYGLSLEEIQKLEDTLATFWDEDKPFHGSGADYSHWSGEDWARIVEWAKSPFAHLNPFDPKESRVERWLESSVGEYVLVSYPELLTSREDLNSHTETMEKLGKLLGGTGPRFGNVVQHPSGYLMGGRADRIGEPNMRH